MARQNIDIGVEGNDGTGDSIRNSFRKVNENFSELYAVFGLGGVIGFTNLSDTPSTLLGNEGKVTLVKQDGSGIDFYELVSDAGTNDPANTANSVSFTVTGNRLTVSAATAIATAVSNQATAQATIDQAQDAAIANVAQDLALANFDTEAAFIAADTSSLSAAAIVRVAGNIHTKVTGAIAGTAGSIKDGWEPLVFDTVTDLLASRQSNRTTGAKWSAGGYRYQNATSDATDNHLTTAGGAKLNFADGQIYQAGTEGLPDSMMIGGGVLRNNTALSGWEWLSDSNHVRRGWEPTVTVVNNQLNFDHTETLDQNVTMMWVPDEFYAEAGMWVGASSSTDTTKVSMAMPLSCKISATDSPSFVAGNTYHTANMSVHWALAQYSLSNVSGNFVVGEEVTAAGTTCIVTYVATNRIDVKGKNDGTSRYAPLGETGTVTGGTSGATATISSRTMRKGWCITHLKIAYKQPP